MKRIAVFLLLLPNMCWCQTAARPEIPTPIVVKLEAPPLPNPPWFVDRVLAPAINAASALFGAGLTLLGMILKNRNDQRANECKWWADKKLEALSHIGLLLDEARHALQGYGEATERCDKYAQAGCSTEEREVVGEARRKASQELSLKRQELSAATGSAGFALSNVLWQQLQSLLHHFIDVSDKASGVTTQERTKQLNALDSQIDTFIEAARKELASVPR